MQLLHGRKLGLLWKERRQLPSNGVAEPCRKVVQNDLGRVARAPPVVLCGRFKLPSGRRQGPRWHNVGTALG